MSRSRRAVARVGGLTVLLVFVVTSAAESAGPASLEDAAAWRERPGFVVVESRISEWLSRSAGGESAGELWRRAVADAPRAARLAGSLRRCAAVADERVASLLSESPGAPPDWVGAIDNVSPSLRLAVAERLYADRRYDACLAWTDELNDADVFSPALLHYLRAVCLRQTVQDEAAAEAAERLGALIEARGPGVLGDSRRWVAQAMLREIDRELDELPVVARRMRDVERRLDGGAPGEETQRQQRRVLEQLDELIKQLEEQQKQQQQQAAAGSGGASPSAPAEESRPSELKGPGEVDRKRLVAGDAWGSLPPAERERLTQEIARDYPPHYRGLIEDYFRTLAEEPEAEASSDP